MELREPKRKRNCNFDLQQTFPIFIESEIGIPIENWVPIICTGIFNGYGVAVKTVAEMCALFNMGNFGKGSNSRSRPYAMRSNPKMPPFIRKRQFNQRKKFTNRIINGKNKFANISKDPMIINLQNEINNLHSALEGVTETTDEITELKLLKNSKTSVINILSSDEENIQLEPTSIDFHTKDPEIIKIKENSEAESRKILDVEKYIDNKNVEVMDTLTFPVNSVMVLPDSNSENDNYFKHLEPKLYIDESEFNECLILTLHEAYFLSYGLGCLQILDENKKPLDLNSSWKLFCSVQKDFSAKYIVYHYFRSKGWIVKPGVKFGGDFLLYKEGQPFYHASYIVLIEVVNQSTSIKSKYDWTSLLGIIRMAGTAVKEVLIAQVHVPADLTMNELHENPEHIEKISVQEVLLRRWLPKLERMDNDDF